MTKAIKVFIYLDSLPQFNNVKTRKLANLNINRSYLHCCWFYYVEQLKYLLLTMRRCWIMRAQIEAVKGAGALFRRLFVCVDSRVKNVLYY
jgi:hypothetical protein